MHAPTCDEPLVLDTRRSVGLRTSAFFHGACRSFFVQALTEVAVSEQLTKNAAQKQAAMDLRPSPPRQPPTQARWGTHAAACRG